MHFESLLKTEVQAYKHELTEPKFDNESNEHDDTMLVLEMNFQLRECDLGATVLNGICSALVLQ